MNVRLEEVCLNNPFQTHFLTQMPEFSVVNGKMNLVSTGDPFAYKVDSRLMDIQVVTLSSPLRRTNRLFDTCGANDRFIGYR